MRVIDRKILSELIRDYVSKSQIAARTRTTRQTVANKMKEFEAKGLIKGYTARLDLERFGGIKAYVLVKAETRREIREENERKIKALDGVGEFCYLFGQYDIILGVWTRDEEDLSKLVKEIHGLDGVTDTETFIVYKIVRNDPERPIMRYLAR